MEAGMRLTALCGFAALAAVTMGLSACNRQAAAAVPGPKVSVIEAACQENLLGRTPNPAMAQIEDFRPVPWREYAAGLRRAMFERLAGEKLGRMQNLADQALTGGESATGGTWVIKLKATDLKGKTETVPAWCRSLRSAPDRCACESPLRTE
jgi:hypothetical protein